MLFIAFEFPPLGGIGVQRSLKFVKYLPAHGVEPVVVTTDADGFKAAVGGARLEASLLREIPPSVRVERVRCPGPPPARGGRLLAWLRHFGSVTDSLARLWRPQALAATDRLVRETRPQAVYVSVPPFSMAPLACEIARRHRLPLMLDFRDPWSQWGSAPKASWWHYRQEWQAEERCLQFASAAATVTEPLRQDFLKAHPRVAADKMSVITNGFDGDIDCGAFSPRATRQNGVFTIGYVGTFYYQPVAHEAIMRPWWRRRPQRWLHYTARREDWLYRTPHFFFAALQALFARRPELRSRVRLRLAGQLPDWLIPQARSFGLENNVESIGYVGFEECQRFQAECDALLLTGTKVHGGVDYTLAGKVFEYLLAGRPILGVVTPGSQRDFLEQCGVATVCDADDPEAGARAIEVLLSGRITGRPDMGFLSRYHRRETAGQMAELLRRCAAPEELGISAKSDTKIGNPASSCTK